ncbi:MAG: GNAT family N-acetyltransferase [Proteobacteria bacterium]|nr:GNAT family N-acetyltransferase [Pseudomonadota bacterium]
MTIRNREKIYNMRAKAEIRKATIEHAKDVAHIHVKSWQQTYAGLIDQAYLDSLDVGARQKRWEESFEQSNQHLYIAFDNSQAVGFVCFGAGRDEAMKVQGEIYAIYLLQEAWSKGIGYALFKTAQDQLTAEGLRHLYLWVLDTNENAIRAYERWGGTLNRAMIKDHVIGQQPVKEIAVVFSGDQDNNSRQ